MSGLVVPGASGGLTQTAADARYVRTVSGSGPDGTGNVAAAIVQDIPVASAVTVPTTYGSNLHPNPTMSGGTTGVIGSGGVLPTGVTVTKNAALSLTFTDNGDGSGNYRFQGSSVPSSSIIFALSAYFPLSPNTDYDVKLSQALASGTMPTAYQRQLWFRSDDGLGDQGYIGFDYNTNLTSTLTAEEKFFRSAVDMQADGYPAGTLMTQAFLNLRLTGISGTVDFTLKLAAPVVRTFTRTTNAYVPDMYGLTLGGKYWSPIGAKKPYSWSVRNAGPNYTTRTEVRTGDRDQNDSSTSGVERSEMSCVPAGITEGVEFWFSYARYVEDNGFVLTAPWMIWGQIHPDDNYGTNPPIAIGYDNSSPADGYGTRYRIWTTFNRSNPFDGSKQEYNYLYGPATSGYLDAPPRNRWVNIVGRGLLEASGTPFTGTAGGGYLQIWQDGVSILNVTGIALGQAAGNVNSYLKMGVYRSASNSGETVIVRYTNGEMVGGVDALRSRILNPLPIFDSY